MALAPASILLSSASFDPRLYLRLVHQYTSYEELSGAVGSLERSLAMRRETLKSLVKQNFDRFVNAKNSIDAVYADMRGKGMTGGDYGMRPATVAVNAALEKAQHVYHPLLRRRSREECIRKRLAVFHEYRQIFSLPAAIHRHVRLGEFQQCVYEYRRGRALLLAEPPHSTLRPILERVWTLHVERAAGVLREALFEKLRSALFPFDVQSKIVGYLLEMEATPDPVGFYLAAKAGAVATHCQQLREETVAALQRNLAVPRASLLEDHVVALLRDALRVVQSHAFDSLAGLAYPAVREWRLIAESFVQLAGQLRGTLVPLARFTATLFAESASARPPGFKLLSVAAIRDRHTRQLEEATRTIVDALQSHADAVFSAVSGQPEHVDNAVVGMHFSLRIVRQLGDAFAAVADANPHVLLHVALKNVFAYVVNALMGRVWRAAIVDCRNMGAIEDWRLSGTGGDDFSTALVRSFEAALSYLTVSTGTCLAVFYSVSRAWTRLLYACFI